MQTSAEAEHCALNKNVVLNDPFDISKAYLSLISSHLAFAKKVKHFLFLRFFHVCLRKARCNGRGRWTVRGYMGPRGELSRTKFVDEELTASRQQLLRFPLPGWDTLPNHCHLRRNSILNFSMNPHGDTSYAIFKILSETSITGRKHTQLALWYDNCTRARLSLFNH